MKYSTLYENALQRRVARLERYVYEKTVGRGTNPSTAFKVWQWLMDEGPKSFEDILNHFNTSAARFLSDGIRERCLFRQNGMYSANPNYEWEDAGVIQRDSTNANSNADNTVANEEPAPTRARRLPRAPREPRQRTVTPNLYSRKYEEVKAAVDAGQPVDQPNEKGVTPLVYACRDSKNITGQIIKLLLDNGANPNQKDGNKPVVIVAMDRKNLDGLRELISHGAGAAGSLFDLNRGDPLIVCAIKRGIYEDDILLSLIPDGARSLYRQYSLWFDIFNNTILPYFLLGHIKESAYRSIVDKLIVADNPENLYLSVRSDSIMKEFAKGFSILADKFKNAGVMPPLPNFRGYATADYRENIGVTRKLYDLIELVSNGTLKVVNVENFLTQASNICLALNKPLDVIYDFVTDDFIKDANKNQLKNLMYSAKNNGNISVLNKIAKSHRRFLENNNDFSDIIDTIAHTRDEATTRALCRILGNNLKSRYHMSPLTVRDIITSSNEYFIEYIFDIGLGQQVIDGMTNIPASDIFRQVATRLGYDIDAAIQNNRNNNPYRLSDDDDYMIDKILRKISEDEWSRDCEQYITQHPEILLDEDIQEAINDPNNASNLTARQLKQRAARVAQNQPKDKYDL
jgi:ankyrin repeat protein